MICLIIKLTEIKLMRTSYCIIRVNSYPLYVSLYSVDNRGWLLYTLPQPPKATCQGHLCSGVAAAHKRHNMWWKLLSSYLMVI